MAENERNELNEDIIESNAARRMRLRGEDMGHDVKTDDIHVNPIVNFWYHNKAAVIIVALFAIMLAVGITQFVTQSNPDIYVIYGGPEHLSANGAKAFAGILENVGKDYNGDGKTLVQLNEFVFMTPEQVDEITGTPDENGLDVTVNLNDNLKIYQRFSNEIFGAESIICILGRGQYEEVKAAGGFMPLTELFDEVPEGAIDEFGVLFSETKLCKYYSEAQVFPDDAVIAIRRLSTMSAITGKKKAEELHGYARDMFVKILSFEYPEGYVPADE